ncbi:hypothetical protein B0F90DRAFT_1813513 [Multifurca ochricompacta]|uniref:Uncharacterized protein n=1 Tax=Multifurca ochricompacta TaxID=376703 RepID=A0AAD4MH80_9AGAM|nr:hypothetical protein B0F90DRAFT_1813513 [Multifurca ochricompacta]
MPSDPVLHHLLRLPFGPYLDEMVLSDKCKSVPSKLLLLDDFMLACNDQPTGFDRTEFEGDLTPQNAVHLSPIHSGSRVFFRGVLSILAIAHLSEEGIEYLNREFQERVTRLPMNGVQAVRRYMSFDMPSLFALKAKQKDVPEAEQYKIKVLIQGHMHSTASFMRSDLVPDGLLFHTTNAAKDRQVAFIASMDVETYKLSRTFLFRYHTLKAMRDILKTYGAGIPVHKRTPQWFLERYFHGFAYPPFCRWHRVNAMEDGESTDEDSSSDLDQVYISRPNDAQTHRPRHLRIVHRNEIWSIFASHSEWIFSHVQGHRDLKGKVDTQTWGMFLMRVSQLRQKAMLNEEIDGKWGLRDEQEGDNQTKVINTIDISALLPNHNILTHFFQPTPAASSSKATMTVSFEDHLDHIYDSDFSEMSSSPTPSHASIHYAAADAAAGSLPPLDPSLSALIPSEMFVVPALPADLIWHCPVGGGTCSYTINLCALSEDNLRLIQNCVSHEDVVHLQRKNWKSNHERTFMTFYEMVNAHWGDHLKELDIKHIRQGEATQTMAPCEVGADEGTQAATEVIKQQSPDF